MRTDLESIVGHIQTVAGETGIPSYAIEQAINSSASLEFETNYKTPKAIEGHFYSKMALLFEDISYYKSRGKVPELSIGETKAKELVRTYCERAAQCFVEAVENPDEYQKMGTLIHNAGNVFIGLIKDAEKRGVDRNKMISMYDQILQSPCATRDFLGEAQYNECVLKRVNGTGAQELIEKYH